MRTLKTSELYNDAGIFFNSFNISSPTPRHYREQIEGRNGFIDLGTDYEGRIIDAKITILPSSSDGYSALRNEVFNLFDSREAFYLQHDELDRKWLVKYNSPFSFARSGNTGEANVQFISSIAFAESVGTTLDASTFVYLNLDVNEKYYSLRKPTFRIFNASDKVIDPREDELKIEFIGQSTNLIIRNTTNGDEWQYTGTTINTDVILLDGIKSFKNGVSIFKDTNYKTITLEKGWNDFELVGVQGVKRSAVQKNLPRGDELRFNPISFEFKYKFL